ncbi:DUF4232 domain-containing protein [Streptomyces sp. SID5785]|uniref:DUF4232 domain-containing protein n=1 Tax=Streptomyces sp. SID5785 TaxID=2690309 RepID=UPI0013618E0B|nr:DUF4232 domain-containing protein [Streptomyces sp. SID5785]MZD10462.1 DUF4232 domain-containing protein [Streptomyces sp. SID5785]
MRARHLTAATTAALALAALTVPAATAAPADATPAAALPRCAEKNLTLRAEPTDDDGDVLRLSLRNDSGRACLVDRVPIVTYGDLDGAAMPLPTVPHAGRTLAAHATAYAAVRSVTDFDEKEKDVRTVMSVTVSAVPEHHGSTFQALTLGAPTGVRVWSPVTTLWQSSQKEAATVLEEQTTGRSQYAT